MKKHFYPDLEWFLLVSRWQYLPPQGITAHWMVWWVWESYAMTFTVSRSQPKWTPLGEFRLLCFPSQNSKHHWGNIFRKNGVTPPNTVPEFCRIYAKTQWSFCGSFWWTNTLQRSFMLLINSSSLVSSSWTKSRLSWEHLSWGETTP